MTAEVSSHDVERTVDEGGSHTARTHVLVASILFLVGLATAAVAALQLVLPDLLPAVAATSYGRLAPASRILIVYGWAVPGLIGLSYFALTTITGAGVGRRSLTVP